MLTKNKLQKAYVMLLVFMASEMANAAAVNTTTGKSHLGQILTNQAVVTTITVAFAILAAWKWIEFFQGFQAESALSKAFTPAVLTFMAFAWGDVLTWVGVLT